MLVPEGSEKVDWLSSVDKLAMVANYPCFYATGLHPLSQAFWLSALHRKLLEEAKIPNNCSVLTSVELCAAPADFFVLLCLARFDSIIDI